MIILVLLLLALGLQAEGETNTNAPAPAVSEFVPQSSSSASLTAQAWQALDAKDYATARIKIASCQEHYESKALEMQAGLTSLPSPQEAHSFWALNDVGTCYFILGKVEEAEGRSKEAMAAYQDLVKRFPMAQCWDKQGWFWQPCVAAKERIAVLTLESTE